MAHETADVVRARRFELVDSSGQIRAELAAPGIGGQQGPALTLFHSRGPVFTRIVLGLDDDGAPMLELFDGEGQPRATVRLGKDGSAQLALLDRDGKVLWKAP